jgi:GH24 family phage-related lysozyme (muramidase)
MFRMWGLLNGRPQNADQVGAWASWRIKEFWKANPHLSEQDVVDKVQRMVRSEWVMDGISGQAVKVPPRFSGPNTQEAITDLTRAFMKTLDKQGNLSDGAYIKYRPMGDNGTYRVEVWNGSYMRGLNTVNLQQVLTDYNIKMNLQASEAQQMRNTLVKLRAGEAAPMLDPILIEKGVTTGFITSQDKALLNKQRLDSTFARLGSPPAVDLGTPNGNNTLEYARGGLKVDPKLTAQAAMDFAYKGTLGQPNHLDLASSLVTAREGVVLKSYSDPARGAGLNIGAGYNLKANAATVAQDLQSVGVPADRIEDIKAGRASLTPEQAKWLTSLTVKRFEGQVQKEANTAKPGLWDSMTPQQRAVMIDVAYQTGDSGQFKQAWKALAAGDKAAFGQQLRTYFTDQSGKRVEDTRALDLRSSMLLGPSAWRARLKVASSP